MTRGISFDRTRYLQVTLTPVAVAQATTAAQTFTIMGLRVGEHVTVNAGVAAQAGLGIVGARVSANDTLEINYCNIPAGGNITPTAGTYYIQVVRPDAYETDGASKLR